MTELACFFGTIVSGGLLAGAVAFFETGGTLFQGLFT